MQATFKIDRVAKEKDNMNTIITTIKYLEEVHGIPQTLWPPPPKDADTGIMLNPTATGAFVKYDITESSVFVELPEPHAARLKQVSEVLHATVLSAFGDCYPVVPFRELFGRESLKVMRQKLRDANGQVDFPNV